MLGDLTRYFFERKLTMVSQVRKMAVVYVVYKHLREGPKTVLLVLLSHYG